MDFQPDIQPVSSKPSLGFKPDAALPPSMAYQPVYPKEKSFDLGELLDQAKRDAGSFLDTMRSSDEQTAKDFNDYGEKTADILQNKLSVDPHISAGIGTGIAILPDAVGLAGLGHGINEGIEALPKVIEGAKSGLKFVSDAARGVYNEVSGANAKGIVSQLTEQAQNAKVAQEQEALRSIALKNSPAQPDLPFMPQKTTVQSGPGLYTKPAYQPGEVIKQAKSIAPHMPDQDLVHKGAMVKDADETLTKMGFTPDEVKQAKQPLFDITKDLPESPADGAHPAGSTVSLETLQKAGYRVGDSHPIELTPATKKPDGTVIDRHEWSPYQRAVMKATDPVQKAEIMADARAHVGFVDDAGQFYTADDYANLSQDGKVVSKLSGKGEPIQFPADLQEAPTPGNVIKFNNSQLRDIRKTGVNVDTLETQKTLPMGDVEKGAPTEPLAIPEPPAPEPKPADPLVDQFSKEITDGKIKDDFVPGVWDMNRQLGKGITADAKTQYAGALQQAKNSITNAESEMGLQNVNYLKKINDMGIEEGSKESKALFNYLEGNLDIEDMSKQIGYKATVKVEKAATFMKDQYSQWLGEINHVRAGRGLAPIAERPNFVNHMNEITSVGDDIINTVSGGAADQTAMKQADIFNRAQPEVPFRHVIRKGAEAGEDAIASFKKYIRDSLSYKYLTPEVDRIKDMQKVATDSGLTNVAARLQDYGQYLSGKPQMMDKMFGDALSTESFQLAKKISGNVVRGVVTLNPDVWEMQALRLFPKIHQDGVLRTATTLLTDQWNKAKRAEMYDNIPFLKRMFVGREEAALQQKLNPVAKMIINIPQLIDQEMAMGTAISSFNAKMGELTQAGGKMTMEAAKKEAYMYAEHQIENIQSLISRSAEPPYFRASAAKMITPLMREATLMTDYITHQILRNEGDMNKAVNVGRAIAGMTSAAALGAGIHYASHPLDSTPKNLIGHMLAPWMKAFETPMSGLKTAVEPINVLTKVASGQEKMSKLPEAAIKTYLLAGRGMPGALTLFKIVDAALKTPGGDDSDK